MKLRELIVPVPHYQKAPRAVLASVESVPPHDESLDILRRAQESPEQRVESAKSVEELRDAVRVAAEDGIKQAPEAQGEIRAVEEKAKEDIGIVDTSVSKADKLRRAIDAQLEGINNPEDRERLADIRAQQLRKLEALQKGKTETAAVDPVSKEERVERQASEVKAGLDENVESATREIESLLKTIAVQGAAVELSIQRDERDRASQAAGALAHGIADTLDQLELLTSQKESGKYVEVITQARKRLEKASELVQRWLALEDRTATIDTTHLEDDHDAANAEQVARLREIERRQALEIDRLREEGGNAWLLLRELGTGYTDIDSAREELMEKKRRREELISDTIKYALTFDAVFMGLRMGATDQPRSEKDVEDLIASIEVYRRSKDAKDFPVITSKQEKFLIQFIAKRDFESLVRSLASR